MLIESRGSLYRNRAQREVSMDFRGILGTLTLYRYGVKIIFNDGRDFWSFKWSCDTRLTLEKVWQQ